MIGMILFTSGLLCFIATDARRLNELDREGNADVTPPQGGRTSSDAENGKYYVIVLRHAVVVTFDIVVKSNDI
jgi:hypothetical protein